jgi:Na+-transporting NADH:ubiquinone oxidoreductase subunit C
MSNANKETFGRTLIFVFIVCLVCAALVSFSAVSLKPLQKANKLLDQHTKILEAAGLSDKADQSAASINAAFDQYIVPKFVNLTTGEYTTGDHEIYDERADARDPEKSTDIQNDIAGIGRRANKAAIYLVKNDDGKIDSVVLPIVGMGLWDIMYGYIGLKADLNTVKSVVYYELKETPGLGAEVQNPKWKAKWKGKKMFDEQGDIAIKIEKGGAKPDDIHVVDALSGATLTSRGVESTIRFWLGDEGYGRFIAKHRGNLTEGGLD